MSCGAIGDRQSCAACGAESMPGEWVPAAKRDELVAENERLRKALIDARGELHRSCLDRGSTEGYRESFAAINAALAEESPT
jgi:hypothetical protein